MTAVLELDVLRVFINRDGITAELTEGQTDYISYYRVRGVRVGQNLTFEIVNVSSNLLLPHLHVEVTGFEGKHKCWFLRQNARLNLHVIVGRDEQSVSVHVWPCSDEIEPDMSPTSDKDRIMVVSFDSV